ncbi:hypothetical protein AGMMS49942_30240 [Spirochaetia bacterium]|nr:hypothetical protein AGMMS49942_30240 [Spirochaetia bacterium]
MENKSTLLFLFLLVLNTGYAYPIEPTDLDGTWLEDMFGTWKGDTTLLRSPSITDAYYFSWGKGRTIPNSSFDFDIDENKSWFSGDGLLIIDTITKQDENTLKVVMYFVGDKELERPYEMTFHFLDRNKYWFEWPQRDESEILKGKDWIHYRVSGPPLRTAQQGTINNMRVRIRKEPNLSGKTLGHLDAGQRVTILRRSEETQRIDDMEAYWYKVSAEGKPYGWVYGGYIQN